MTFPRAGRQRSLLVALPLLVLQAVGGGAVALAHTSDAVPVAATVEAQHSSGCPILHDALRCALCHYAATRVVTHRAAVVVPDVARHVALPPVRRVRVAVPTDYLPAPPRAPPAFLS